MKPKVQTIIDLRQEKSESLMINKISRDYLSIALPLLSPEDSLVFFFLFFFFFSVVYLKKSYFRILSVNFDIKLIVFVFGEKLLKLFGALEYGL